MVTISILMNIILLVWLLIDRKIINEMHGICEESYDILERVCKYAKITDNENWRQAVNSMHVYDQSVRSVADAWLKKVGY